MRLPPRWVRRVLLWPLPVVAVVAYVTTVPLLLVAAFVVSYRLPGKLRAVRGLGLISIYLFVEAGVVLAALALWIGSGFGWRLRSPTLVAAHYAVLRWALRVLVGAGRRLFSLEIEADGDPLPVPGTADDPARDRPAAALIVMSRHAGPADSLLLLNEVMSWQGRRPRIVAKDLLQLDPAFDIILNRLPNRFISPAGGSAGTVEAIADLAEGMTGGDAFVIFPEGGNFTEGRRIRAIDRLRRGGYEAAVERAMRLRNVLPPRPAGTVAALRAAPKAGAVFVAHTGLDAIATLGDVWLALPEDKVLRLHWHRVPADVVPAADSDKEEMLYQAWEAIDAWIDAHRSR